MWWFWICCCFYEYYIPRSMYTWTVKQPGFFHRCQILGVHKYLDILKFYIFQILMLTWCQELTDQITLCSWWCSANLTVAVATLSSCFYHVVACHVMWLSQYGLGSLSLWTTNKWFFCLVCLITAFDIRPNAEEFILLWSADTRCSTNSTIAEGETLLIPSFWHLIHVQMKLF